MEHAMHPNSGGRTWSAEALAEAVDDLSDEERDLFLYWLHRQGPPLVELLRAKEEDVRDQWVVVPTEVFAKVREVILKLTARHNENMETAAEALIRIAEEAVASREALAKYQLGPAARSAKAGTLDRDRLIDQLIEKEGFDPAKPSAILKALKERNPDCVEGVRSSRVMMRGYQQRKAKRTDCNR
jgi:hypothetical protein